MLIGGRYQLLEALGAGAQGAVWRARDRRSRHDVALKLAHGTGEALLGECRRWIAVSSPALPRVLDVARLDTPVGDHPIGTVYMVMALAPGVPLAELPPLSVGPLLAVMRDVTLALAALHHRGLLHRDVSPRNVVVATDNGTSAAMLVDLGHSSRDGTDVRGTLGFMAPEALVGAAEERSDIYALGATAWCAVRGRAPVPASDVAAAARATLTGPPPQLDELPSPVRDLIAGMLAADPAARPSSAAVLARRIEALADALGTPLRPATAAARAAYIAPAPPRPDEAARIAAALRPGVCTVVVAAPGHGVRAVAQDVARAQRLAAIASDAPTMRAGTLDELATELATAAPPGPRRAAQVVAAVLATAAPTALVLEPDELGAALAAAIAGAGPGLVLLTEGTALPALPDDVARIDLAPLDVDAMATWIESATGAPAPGDLATRLHQLSGGLPTVAAELLAAALASDGGLADGLAATASATRDALLEAWWARHAEHHVAAVRLALVQRRDDPALDRVLLGDDAATIRAELATATVLARDAAMAPATAALVLRLAGPRVVTREAAAVQRLATGVDAVAAARAAVRLPITEARTALITRAAEQLIAAGAPHDALALLRPIVARGPTTLARLAAEAALLVGDAALATTLAGDAGDGWLAGRALRRLGRLTEASAALEATLAADDRPGVRAELARVAIARGEFATARAWLPARPPDEPAPIDAAVAEAAGLAALYQGALADATAWFAALARAATSPAATARAHALHGLVAQRRGDLTGAASHYAAAARSARAAGDVLAAAVADANCGIALAPAGRSGEAVAVLSAAVRALGVLGARAEHASAECNRGVALLGVHALDAAAASAARAIAIDPTGITGQVYAPLLQAEVARARGELPAARALAAAALAAATGPEARLAAAVVAWDAGGDAPDELEAAAWMVDAADRDRARLALARRQLLCRTPSRDTVTALEAGAARDRAAGRLEVAWRADAVAAATWRALGEAALAHAAAERALAAHDALVAGTPAAWQAGMADDPDRRLARDVLPTAAAPAPAPGTDDAAHLRRLLALSRRLYAATDVAPLLGEIIDAAIELADAERGFLVLATAAAAFEVAVARNLDATALQRADAGFSRSIAAQAMSTGEPVLTVDAGDDARFEHAGSIAALRLRSVLAVPLMDAGAAVGCIVVDHRLRRGAFDDALALRLVDLAGLAAVALRNARMAQALRERSAEADRLGVQLAAELATREAELAVARAALPAERARLRGRYERIVGESPAVVAMLGLVDRAAASALPVVLVGESGTGKELVARALHDHGPRAAQPFVAINCGALPDTLLESELFGHARGAFTGADRERAGLFEVADGGTLFLDEIADTSAAMQGRLLRVLQEGVVRRVGEHRERQIDVRVVAASQQPLAALARTGRFRDDLRYRLEVIAIELPPLRARTGDLPLLVNALLARLAPGRTVAVSRAALRALALHAWPGNVRELENVLARALALGGDRIDLPDLPTEVLHPSAGSGAISVEPGADLTLRVAVDALERSFLDAALQRAGGNQSEAARLLGLSRFGLQKKLRRLAPAATDGSPAAHGPRGPRRRRLT